MKVDDYVVMHCEQYKYRIKELEHKLNEAESIIAAMLKLLKNTKAIGEININKDYLSATKPSEFVVEETRDMLIFKLRD